VFAPSWNVMAVVLGLVFAPVLTPLVQGAGGLAALAVAAAVPLILLLCVLADECAHGIAGHAEGSPTREYVLTLWGGHTQFATDMRPPGAAALVSIVGPLANAVLAVAAWLAMDAAQSVLAAVLWQIAAVSNAVVAGFNLLRGYPLDGG